MMLSVPQTPPHKFSLNAYERVMAVLGDQPADCVPAINPTAVVTALSLKLSNVKYPEAHTNAHQMAKLASIGHEHFGFDSVMPYFSVHLESAALGSTVDWYNKGNQTPKVICKALDDMDNLDIPADFLNRREFQRMLQAIRLLGRQYKNKVAVIGKVVGPWSLAYNLYGVENLIVDMILEPEKTRKFIQELVQVPIAFAKAQFEAGADLVTWADHTTADIISARTYEQFVLPAQQQAAAALADHGPVILHVCGNIMDRLPLFARIGFELMHLDSRNDLTEAVEMTRGKMKLVGAINNPLTLVRGLTRQVQEEVEQNIRQGMQLIAPECALPLNVPENNLLTLVRTAHAAALPAIQ